MQFNSTVFIFLFLPIVIAGHSLLKSVKLRNLWLLLAGFGFYGWCNIYGLLFLLVYGAVNYGFVKAVSGASRRKLWMIVGICVDVLLLYVFKYLDFTAELLGHVLGSKPQTPDLFQPMGISFITFTMIAYLADLYRGTAQPLRNPLDFLLYLSFFAKAGQGPIVRYDGMLPELTERSCTREDFYGGLHRFIIGFAKKVMLADVLGKTVDAIYGTAGLEVTAATAWLGMLFYTFQIYYDFSGYTDMALGIGRMLGFRLPENFNDPYFSKSVSEFWNRWHMTLGSWFKDYIYIPLGGNRRGKVRQIFNLSVVWFVTGLWHGASVHYILWGVYYGFFVILEKQIMDKQWYKAIPDPVKWGLTFLLTVLGWTIFRSSSVGEMLLYFRAMLGMADSVIYRFGYFFDLPSVLAFGAAVVCALPKPERAAAWLNESDGGYPVKNLSLALLFGAAVVFMVNSTYNSFIYFQF